jgi:hypothetical protein
MLLVSFAFFVRYDRSPADCYNLFPFMAKAATSGSEIVNDKGRYRQEAIPK